MRSITQRFYSPQAVVFSVAPGSLRYFFTGPSTQCLSTDTPLPEDLVLVHEFKDHYSLQPAKELPLDGSVVPSFNSHTYCSPRFPKT